MVKSFVWKRESKLLAATMEVEKWFGHKIPSVGNWLSHEKRDQFTKVGERPRSMQHSYFWKVSLRQGANFYSMVAKSGRDHCCCHEMICGVLSLKCQLFQHQSGANVIGRWFHGEWIINVVNPFERVILSSVKKHIVDRYYYTMLPYYECHPVIEQGLSVKDVTNSSA